MQIQRIQTLFLLIAAILTGAFCFLPYATIDVDGEIKKLFVSDVLVLMIFNLTITALLVITIFLYRNIRFQMKIAKIDIALVVGSVITTLVYIYVGNARPVPAFCGGAIMLAIAEAFIVAAYRKMDKDRKLLASVDRIR